MYTFTENLLVIYLFFLQGQRHGDGYRIPITHHLFLNLKNFTYNSINEDVEVFFSLYDARENKCIRLDSHTSLVKTRRQTRPICRIQISDASSIMCWQLEYLKQLQFAVAHCTINRELIYMMVCIRVPKSSIEHSEQWLYFVWEI